MKGHFKLRINCCTSILKVPEDKSIRHPSENNRTPSERGGGHRRDGVSCVHASILSLDVTEESELSARGEIVHHRRGAPRRTPQDYENEGPKTKLLSPFEKIH
ncbi:hypothetical protein CDAR_70721 [Caerostris darwini]|uniref:Uncharacterized protein n=1 Tax=Caerostris darwini TaxID=1538125 RepID=A0AAV4WHV2_9ARAC|nr:hypothetical protein CDAR_70721 [Caerostris darwini]